MELCSVTTPSGVRVPQPRIHIGWRMAGRIIVIMRRYDVGDVTCYPQCCFFFLVISALVCFISFLLERITSYNIASLFCQKCSI